MDKLDAIFRTNLFVTERTDTSMGIRRKDPEDERHPKDHKDQKEDDEFGEDHTTLSVSALHGFLNSLLQQAGQASSEPVPATDTVPQTPPPPPTPAQSGYRAAANAYQSTAQAGTHSAIPLNDPPPPDQGGAPPIVLSQEELRSIDRLLHDVEKLAARGVATITLYPAETFLQSLSLGVNEALQAL